MKKNEVYGRSVPINFNPLFRVMKLCLLFTVMLNLSVVAATNAQLKKVSLIMENAELRQVFKKIKQQTGVRFFIMRRYWRGRNLLTLSCGMLW